MRRLFFLWAVYSAIIFLVFQIGRWIVGSSFGSAVLNLLIASVLGLAFLIAIRGILLFLLADKEILSRNQEAKRLVRINNKGEEFSDSERKDYQYYLTAGIIEAKRSYLEKGGKVRTHTRLSDSAKKELWNSQDRH